MTFNWPQIFFDLTKKMPTGKNLVERMPIYRARAALIMHLASVMSENCDEIMVEMDINERKELAFTAWDQIAHLTNESIRCLPPLSTAASMTLYSLHVFRT
jgi:hypothetical protein